MKSKRTLDYRDIRVIKTPVKVVGRNQINRSIDGQVSIGEVVKSLKLRDDQYVALVNGSPATGDVMVTDSDDVVFLEVFSGG